MARTTFDIPDDLSGRIATLARRRGLNIGTVVEQALLLWEKVPPEDIATMAGPLAGLSSEDRKRVANYVELLKIGQRDIKMCAVKRVRRFLALAREERPTP